MGCGEKGREIAVSNDPADLGIVVTAWRPGQREAIERALNSKKRFVVVSAPTGAGKSLISYGAARALTLRPAATGALSRAAILTGSKGLQDQMEREFPSIATIKGMNAYECLASEKEPKENCDKGACLAGFGCFLRDAGCLYYDQVKIAKAAPIVSTNYAYWLASNGYSDGLGTFDLLVCDEAHSAMDFLGNYLGVVLNEKAVKAYVGRELPDAGSNDALWTRWLETSSFALETIIEDEKDQLKNNPNRRVMFADRIRKMADLKKNVDRALKGIGAGGVVRYDDTSAPAYLGRQVKFDVVWPGAFSGELFLNIPKVIFLSATITPKDIELLGIKPDEYEWIEIPSTFPKERRPMTWVNTVRVAYNWSETQKRIWLSRIDRVIETRSGKGIIHTVSYERARYVMENSDYKSLMITHESRGAMEAVEKFKASSAPSILVSPSIQTGFDFPHDLCRWQIIGKIPFLDSRNPVTKRRTDEDDEYGTYVAMQAIVQAYGRGDRAAEDWCECFIIDDHWQWFWGRARKFAPKWFAEAVRNEKVIGESLEEILGENARAP